MEHTFKIEKELKITTENIVDCVLSCEAGGFDYWGELCSDEKDYEAARRRLTEREKADMKPCYEDVLAEILESGGKLTVYDREDDKDHELTLEKLLNGWKKYTEDHNADDFDEYDGISADCIQSGRKKRAGAGSRLYPVDSFPEWLQGIPPGRAVRKVRSDREHFGRHLRHAGHQSGIAGGRCQIHATQGTP